MRLLFLLGWVLMLAAFAAAAAEVAVGAVRGGSLWITGFGELWRGLAPDSYVDFRLALQRAAPWLWDGLLGPLFQLPGWLLLGLPGVGLAWFCRPGREMTEAEREDLEHRHDSLFLLDELARDARRQAAEDGYDPMEDDSVPSHVTHDLLEAAERDEVEVDEHILEEIRRRDGDTGPPGRNGG